MPKKQTRRSRTRPPGTAKNKRDKNKRDKLNHTTKAARKPDEIKERAEAVRQMYADLARSDLNRADALTMRVELMPEFRGNNRPPDLPYFPGQSYKLPYFDRHGQLTGFYRCRFLDADAEPRYLQPLNSLPQVYFPPNVENWDEILEDVKIDLIIGEGEKKSYCTCKEKGLYCLGLGGAFSFQSRKNFVIFLAELERIKWAGRRVFIALDSDTATNSQVLLAERRLATELTKRGARVYIVRLTAGKDGKKRGLDDLLVQEGRAALDALLADAQATKLEQLHRDFAVVDKLSAILRKTDGRTYSAYNFRTTSGAQYNETGVGQNGRPTLIDNIQAWIQAPRTRYDNVVFKPTEPAEAATPAPDCLSYNLWRGWPVEPARDDQLLQVLHDLFEHLFLHSSQREYQQDYFAHKVQLPKIKMPIVPIWFGAQGVGKTQLAEMHGAMFAPHYRMISGRDLESNFNEWGARNLMLLVNELALRDKRQAADVLKTLFSDREVRVNEKYGPAYFHDNLINFIITTNHPNPLYIEPGDRRFFMPELRQQSLDATPALRELKQRVAEAIKNPAFVAAALHYYKHRSLARFDAFGAPPITATKMDAINDSYSAIERFVVSLKEDPDRWWRVCGMPIPCDLGEVQQVVAIYHAHHNATGGAGRDVETQIGIAMSRFGFPRLKPTGKNKSGTVYTNDGMMRLRAIRNWDRWRDASPAAWVEHYNEMHSEKVDEVAEMRKAKLAGRDTPRPAATPRT